MTSRLLKRDGHPQPTGDPLSGLFFLVEQPAGPRAIEALMLCLESVNLPDAYVTVASTGTTRRELLICDPSLLVAVGPDAASQIDRLGDPLAQTAFSDATVGKPFAWKPNCAGLLLPSLNEALDDPERKRRFWRAFLTLKAAKRTRP